MGKTLFITGGSSDIGEAIIERLKQDGWGIISPSHEELDLNNIEEVIRYSYRLLAEIDNLDVFVHVAGIWHTKDEVLANKTIGTFNPLQIVETMNVGVVAPMVILNILAPKMDGCTVVGISGTFGDGAKGWVPYFTSKRALEDFLLGLSQDNNNLKVFGISPSDTATEAYKKFYPNYFKEAQSPKEVAKLLFKIVNGEAGYQSGSVIELRNAKTRVAFHS